MTIPSNDSAYCQPSCAPLYQVVRARIWGSFLELKTFPTERWPACLLSSSPGDAQRDLSPWTGLNLRTRKALPPCLPVAGSPGPYPPSQARAANTLKHNAKELSFRSQRV